MRGGQWVWVMVRVCGRREVGELVRGSVAWAGQVVRGCVVLWSGVCGSGVVWVVEELGGDLLEGAF